MTRTTNNRMLKTVVSVVLASLGPSTYLTHVRLGPSLAAALRGEALLRAPGFGRVRTVNRFDILQGGGLRLGDRVSKRVLSGI